MAETRGTASWSGHWQTGNQCRRWAARAGGAGGTRHLGQCLSGFLGGGARGDLGQGGSTKGCGKGESTGAGLDWWGWAARDLGQSGRGLETVWFLSIMLNCVTNIKKENLIVFTVFSTVLDIV